MDPKTYTGREQTRAPNWVTEALAARPPIMTPDEVCKDLRISRRTLGRMVADGRLRAVHIGGQLRIPRAEVQSYLATLRDA